MFKSTVRNVNSHDGTLIIRPIQTTINTSVCEHCQISIIRETLKFSLVHLIQNKYVKKYTF